MKYRLLGACAVAVCCAVPAFAQGLSRVELIGLQQQLRDDGCGVTHVTGRMDAMTRSAVKKCESKYSGATDARSMLAAMHIGFENGNQDPTMSMARSGGGSMSSGGMSGSMGNSMNDSSGRHMRRGMKGAMRDSTGSMHRGMGGMMRDSSGRMMNDSAGHRMMRKGKMRDSTMKMRDHDTTGMRGSGGMVDMNKATPMTNPRGSSTMGTDSPTMKRDTMPKHDTMPETTY